MREVVFKVAFGIFCEIADGIFKSFVKLNIVHPSLETQALFGTHNITMSHSMRRIVAGYILPLAIQVGNKDNRKIGYISLYCSSANQKRKAAECYDPVFIRHYEILRRNKSV